MRGRKFPVLGLVWLVFCLVPVRIFSQANLVLNPGFEDHSDCPTDFSQMKYCTNWSQPTAGTSDYYSDSCSQMATNTLFRKFHECQAAHSGYAFAGFFALETPIDYREYVSGTLSEPLVSGRMYKISFYVNLLSYDTADYDHAAISDLGLYFSGSKIFNLLYSHLTYKPQILNPAARYLQDTLNWVEVKGVYRAKGGEQYITIGNFNDDTHTHYKALQNSPYDKQSYYFIDDVSVTMASKVFYRDTVYLCNGKKKLITGSANDTTGTWNDNSVGDSLLVDKAGIYWKSYISYGDTVTDTIVVLNDTLNLKTIGNIANLCSGQWHTIKLFQAGAAYKWSDKTTNDSFIIQKPGTYFVTAIRHGCSVSDTFLAKYDTSIVFKLPSDTFLCKGQSILFDLSYIKEDVKWQDSSTNKKYVVNKPGFYTVKAKNACGIFTATVQVKGLDLKDSLNLPDTIRICYGQTHSFTFPVNSNTYTWNGKDTGRQFIIGNGGIYTVFVTGNGCTATDTVVAIYDSATVINLPKDTILCLGQSILFDVSAMDGSVKWQDSASTKKYIAKKEGTYIVKLKNGCGTFSDSVKIGFQDCNCYLYIPNSFSPDDNLANDSFMARSNCKPFEYLMSIYNRWGELIFESTDIDKGWDGKFKSAICPEGVYLFVVKYRFGNAIWQVRSGTLTILE